MSKVVEILRKIEEKLNEIDKRLRRIEEELFDELLEENLKAYKEGKLELIDLKELEEKIPSELKSVGKLRNS